MHVDQTTVVSPTLPKRPEFEVVSWSEVMLYPKGASTAGGNKAEVEAWLTRRGFEPSANTPNKWLLTVDKWWHPGFLVVVKFSGENAALISPPGTNRLEGCRWFGSVANPFGSDHTYKMQIVRDRILKIFRPQFHYEIGRNTHCLKARYFQE